MSDADAERYVDNFESFAAGDHGASRRRARPDRRAVRLDLRATDDPSSRASNA